jgi:protein-S-isoprenylcysteine O-methyltransferase Ste14
MVFAFCLMLILYIKRIEERELGARFGEEYLTYKMVTPFLIPRIFPRRSYWGTVMMIGCENAA